MNEVPKPKCIAKWTEVSQTYLSDGPPKRRDFEAVMLKNDCEVWETKKGKRLIRRTGWEFLYGATEDAVTEKVRRFLLHDDVRVLVKDLDTNDFDALPKEESATVALIDGTDDIYADKFKIGVEQQAADAEGGGE